MTPCCSFGYCTQQSVCDGNKLNGDVCKSDTECLSGFCNKQGAFCQTRPEITKDKQLLQLGGLAALILFILSVICCYKLLKSGKSGGVRPQRASTGDSDDKFGTPNSHKKEDRHHHIRPRYYSYKTKQELLMQERLSPKYDDARHVINRNQRPGFQFHSMQPEEREGRS